MQKQQFVTMLAALLVSLSSYVFAQTDKDIETVTIKTSSQCEMCKKRIEKEMGLKKGVKSAVLNLDDHTLTVTYQKDKTDPNKLRKALANIGYDADDIAANQKSYNKLPACCKKGGHDNDHKH
ncbi:heavy-metal-associated domain-containing protein [Rhodoflexus sp.]